MSTYQPPSYGSKNDESSGSIALVDVENGMHRSSDVSPSTNNSVSQQQLKSKGKHSWMNVSSLWRRSEMDRKASKEKTRMVPTKVEPKVFFSNERTFLSWLSMAVTLATISLAVIA